MSSETSSDHKTAGVTFKVAEVAPKVIKGVPFSYEEVKAYQTMAAGKVLQGSMGKVSEPLLNGISFVHMVTGAYNHHHNLVLRPDDIWLAIMIQFAKYVELEAEALRSKFVSHEGQKELKVHGDGTLLTANYGEFSKAMTTEIAKNLKDDSVRDWVLPDFTTTTDTDRVVGSIALMAGMQKYFTYKFCLECGIPEVTLQGTKEDWKKIEVRAQRLLEFDNAKGYMTTWYVMLGPILSKFTESFTKPDINWWNRVCSYKGGGSGPTYLSGWMTAFCVFNDQGGTIAWQGNSKEARRSKISGGEWLIIDTDDIPSGICTVPVTVDDNGTEYKTRMFAGHMAYQSPEGNTTLIPRVDWFISLIDEKKVAEQKQKKGRC